MGVDPKEPSGRFDLLETEKETHIILSLSILKQRFLKKKMSTKKMFIDGNGHSSDN